jgi:hypothetical protein
MTSPRPDASDRKDLDTASAEWLLQTDDSSRPAPPKPVLPPGAGEEFELADVPSDRPPPPSSDDDFELVDLPSDPPQAPVQPPAARAKAAPVPENPAKSSTETRPRPRARLAAPDRPAVEEVWTRAAEWRQTLLVLAAWAFAIFGLLFFAARAELFEMSLLVLFVGFLGGVILSYPILITLERPVRITPEQAARDYFGALSHHLPHYRRMWLLLSTRGRTSAHFDSFEEFKAYWMGLRDRLRKSYAGRFAPLIFRVKDFEGDKSADKSEMKARFKVKVFVSGRDDEKPVLSVPLQRGFVRGPDGMWYLEDGTLPENEAPQREKKRPYSEN